MIQNNKSGLVLAEAMMAVALLAISVVVTASIISTSVSTTYLSRNYLIAQNLATEAIEVVKTVRNTNWLINPSDSSCWLTLNPPGGCNVVKATAGNSYVPTFSDGSWALTSLIAGENGNAGIQIDDTGVFYQGIVSDQTPHPAFQRSITFDTVDPGNEYASFTVTVSWKEGQKDRSINRIMTIYNYY